MSESADELKLSGVAITFNFIAAILLITTGIITAFSGGWELLFGGVHRDTETIIELSARTWGAIHFGLGILMLAAGFNLFVGHLWARIVGIAVSTIILMAAIIAMPESPVFSAGLIVFNAVVLWSLLFHGKDMASIAA